MKDLLVSYYPYSVANHRNFLKHFVTFSKKILDKILEAALETFNQSITINDVYEKINDKLRIIL